MAAAKPKQVKGLTSRGVSTRRRIVDTTANLMYLNGVEATSLDDVRQEAGVSKSQLYHYFSDKDALVGAVIATQTERVMAAQQPALDRIDSLKALRRWGNAVLALYRLNGGKGGCPLGSLASELANQSEPARAMIVAGFDAWAEHLAEGIARMRALGELKPSVQPAELATSVLAAVQGGLLLAKSARSEKPLALALKMAIDHVERYEARSSRTAGRSATMPRPGEK